jgi:hypothetical protein
MIILQYGKGIYNTSKSEKTKEKNMNRMDKEKNMNETENVFIIIEECKQNTPFSQKEEEAFQYTKFLSEEHPKVLYAAVHTIYNALVRSIASSSFSSAIAADSSISDEPFIIDNLKKCEEHLLTAVKIPGTTPIEIFASDAAMGILFQIENNPTHIFIGVHILSIFEGVGILLSKEDPSSIDSIRVEGRICTLRKKEEFESVIESIPESDVPPYMQSTAELLNEITSTEKMIQFEKIFIEETLTSLFILHDWMTDAPMEHQTPGILKHQMEKARLYIKKEVEKKIPEEIKQIFKIKESFIHKIEDEDYIGLLLFCFPTGASVFMGMLLEEITEILAITDILIPNKSTEEKIHLAKTQEYRIVMAGMSDIPEDNSCDKS